MVSGSDQVWLQVEAADDEDDGDLAALTLRLRAELLDLDVASVDQAPADEDAPPSTMGPGTKGLITVAGKLLVWLGPAGLGTVLSKIADWAARNGRPVEITIDGDSLILGRASREQQDQLVKVFLERHSPSP